MWKRLPSSRINKIAWDACVHTDPMGVVYALSWYLDAVAPGWEGWVKEENGAYAAVMPIATRKIVGFSIISQPLLTQQFGLYIKNRTSFTLQWAELAQLLFRPGEAVEKYSFQAADYSIVKLYLPLKERINLVLPLNLDYATLKGTYHPNRQRDLKKATTANLQLQTGAAYWPEVYALYQENVFPRLKKRQQAELLQVIPRLVKAAMAQGLVRIYLVSLPSGQIVAGALFLHYKNRLIYLLPAATKTGKKVGASTYLLDQVCRQVAGSSVILDFEGSSQPGLARFYTSLGAQPEFYGLLENYNFSLPLKLLYAFKNWFKKLRSPALRL